MALEHLDKEWRYKDQTVLSIMLENHKQILVKELLRQHNSDQTGCLTALDSEVNFRQRERIGAHLLEVVLIDA